MISNTSNLDQPMACSITQDFQQGLQGDTRLAIDPGTGVPWEDRDCKDGSWFENQVEQYKKKLRKPHKKD